MLRLQIVFFVSVLTVVSGVSIDKFYPFGGSEDSQLPSHLYEASTQQIFLSVPIRFYGETYSYIYVNANGLLSFLAPLPYFLNIPFPLDYPVIAPFYANVDTRRSGNIFYRETKDATLLKRATSDIQRLFPHSSSASFLPTSLFIATWSKVGYYDRGYDKVNTYQAVIISNGAETFVQFLYSDDGIQWLQSYSGGVSGLSDAKAQAGLVASDGRIYALKGSGTDQVRNLNRWSNTDVRGVWMFRVGNIPPGGNVELPQIPGDGQMEAIMPGRLRSCTSGYTLCHSQAECADFSAGFCCFCKSGFYGNGYNCLKKDAPLRANGKVNVTVNGITIPQFILQAYIAVADGRSYTAISKVPTTVGFDFQLLYPLSIPLGWLFAKPINNALNGYQLTGGVLNYTAQIGFKETGDRLTITQRYFGLDVFDQLSMEANVKGSIPLVTNGARISIDDYQQQFTRTSPGVFQSISSLTYITAGNVNRTLSMEQTIIYTEACPINGSDSVNTYRVKTARNFVDYESKENILRFAATNKVSSWSESDDPCIEGRIKCVANSSCIVEGDAFKCICNPGFRTSRFKIDVAASEGIGCSDVNECAEGLHNCDQNAICVNEVGSYSCQCKPGYTGNGYYCSAVESPCMKYPALCNPPNSYCADPTDPSTCTCQPGYNKTYLDETRIGFACYDIDECAIQSPCSANATCYNADGSYMCECNPGFTGNGAECVQIITKSNPCESVTCSEGSECVSDSYGETRCVCRAGYIQTEDRCELAPVNGTAGFVSCDIARDCSPNADCILNETSQHYTCKCIRGYYGDGYTCNIFSGPRIIPKYCILENCWCPGGFTEKSGVCVENEEGQSSQTPTEGVSCNVINICHPNGQCVYNSSTQDYRCQCNAGYEGNGFECTEIEASCKRIDNCDVHATCQIDEISGHAMCVCNPFYQGDGIHCVYTGHCISDGDCGQNEECVFDEKTDGYDCHCISGHVKNKDGICVERKACPRCHQFAECINSSSSIDMYCQCLPGYTGDGITQCTVLPPPCNVINNCSPFASCMYDSSLPGFSCVCRRGYEGNGTYCYSTKTCLEEPEICHTNATCVRRRGGTPICECRQGFIGNGYQCSEIPKHEGNFLLVNHGIATLRMPYQPSPSDPTYPIYLQPTQTAIGIAIDCVEGRVYWSDYVNRVIRSATYKGRDVKDVVAANMSSPEGLAIDWINRALYWTDSDKDTIESIKLDGTERHVVISSGLVNPRGIAVDPYKRKLYWSDWNRAFPKIEWSNLDGSERSILARGDNVQLPNSVAVDWSMDELCWADAGVKAVECIGVNSGVARTAVGNCSYPFGLTITDTRYFWTDWSMNKVGTSDKRGNKLESLPIPLTGSGRLYGIVAVPEKCP